MGDSHAGSRRDRGSGAEGRIRDGSDDETQVDGSPGDDRQDGDADGSDEGDDRGFFAGLTRLGMLALIGYGLWVLLTDPRRRRRLVASDPTGLLAELNRRVSLALAEGRRATRARRAELEAAAGNAIQVRGDDHRPRVREDGSGTAPQR